MTPETFIQRFNQGDNTAKSKLFVDLDLKEADYHLEIPLPKGSPYQCMILSGYETVKAAVWYIRTVDDRRLPVAAFKIHPNPFDTFESWKKTVPLAKFADMFKELVVDAFIKPLDEKPVLFQSAN